MANTYLVDFTVTLSKCMEFATDTEEQALELARKLLDNDKFREELVAEWDDPWSGWQDPNDPVVLACHEDSLPDYTNDELKEYFGVEV